MRAEQAELEGRRKQVDALEAAGKAKDEEIATLRRMLDEQGKALDDWKAAAAAGKAALEACDAIKASYAASVADFTKELDRVRGERDDAIKRGRWAFVKGLASGLGVAALVVVGVLISNR